MTPNIVENYQKVDNSHGCCISGDDFHQRCQCSLTLSKCMQFCNADQHCKGYVLASVSGYCQIATVSDCPSGCTSHDVGNVGQLIVDGTCGAGYGGCFIKQSK